MTDEGKNIQMVKDVFAAISRGDLQSVQDRIADDIDWQSPATNTIDEPISWAKPRRGRAEVNAFLKDLFEKVKLIEFGTGRFAGAKGEGDITVTGSLLPPFEVTGGLFGRIIY